MVPAFPTSPSRARRRGRLCTTAVTVIATAAAVLVGFVAPATADPVWQKGIPPLATPWTAQVSPTNALPEYPRPQMTRPDWRNLNGVWQFGAAQAGDAPPIGRDLGERILVPYPVESALSGIQRHVEEMFYRRTFTVPDGWQVGSGKRLILNFGAVDYKTSVWVNGTKVVDAHLGGYEAFSADITDALTPSGAQELIVGVEDLGDKTLQPVGKQRDVPDRGIFYTSSSGIWQTVWMEPVAAGHINRLQMTPDLPSSTLRLSADTTGADGLTVQAVAYDGKKVVGSVTAPAASTVDVPVPNPKLWSPDSPFLYNLKVTLLRDKTVVDQVGSYFGMREVGKAKGTDGRLHLTLNGKILFQDATLDQGFWPDGIYTAPTDAALRFDLVQTKKLGFNAVRKHIKVEPDRWYYAADQIGLLVWQDMPAMRTGDNHNIPVAAQDEFKRELHTIVDQHKSWTSIVAWVPFNEGWGEWDRAATGAIADSVKAQDPSRLVNAHSGVNCCDSLGDSGRGDIIDSHSYLGPANPVPTDTRVSVDGEHGGLGLKTSNHMWFGDGFAYEMENSSAALTSRFAEVQSNLLTNAKQCGISAGVYTQITDVEGELNGFFTYDRQVTKMDVATVRAVNRAVIAGADGSPGDVVTPGPGTPGIDGIHAYNFDEGSGDVAHDSVGSADATLIGGAGWTAGHSATSGSALAANGSGQFADTGATLLDTTGNYSVAAWVKLNAPGGGFQTAVSEDGDTNSAFYLQYSGADRRLAFSFVGVRALAPTAPVAGQWYHMVGVRDAVAKTLKLYVDGALVATQTACIADAGTGHTVIGRGKFGGGPVDFLDGAVDSVHLYDRALTDSEVSDLFASGG